jgi:hypothetical protein
MIAWKQHNTKVRWCDEYGGLKKFKTILTFA